MHMIMHARTYTHTHTNTQTHTCTYARTHTNIHAHTRTQTRSRTRTHTHSHPTLQPSFRAHGEHVEVMSRRYLQNMNWKAGVTTNEARAKLKSYALGVIAK